jgi:hypothetical protein
MLDVEQGILFKFPAESKWQKRVSCSILHKVHRITHHCISQAYVVAANAASCADFTSGVKSQQHLPLVSTQMLHIHVLDPSV